MAASISGVTRQNRGLQQFSFNKSFTKIQTTYSATDHTQVVHVRINKSVKKEIKCDYLAYDNISMTRRVTE